MQCHCRLSVRPVPLLLLALGSIICHVASASQRQRNPGPAGPRIAGGLRSAYILSFRSPDLLANRADDRWGRGDGRLYAGRIVSDLPTWLRWKVREIQAAREIGRPILLSLHVHSGFGTGLVSYTQDLRHAEAVNYPWLVRLLESCGLNQPDVMVTIDTCNAQATAAHQLRPDLVPGGVSAFGPFAAWRSRHPARRQMDVGSAYRLFSVDRVRRQLTASVRGNRENVNAVAYEPLTEDEKASLKLSLFGQKGVIISTPALFNLLRLGPAGLQATNTADLLHGRLELRILGDDTLAGNVREFRRFSDFSFLAQAGASLKAAANGPGEKPAGEK
jgi:hypothetical protein